MQDDAPWKPPVDAESEPSDSGAGSAVPDGSDAPAPSPWAPRDAAEPTPPSPTPDSSLPASPSLPSAAQPPVDQRVEPISEPRHDPPHDPPHHQHLGPQVGPAAVRSGDTVVTHSSDTEPVRSTRSKWLVGAAAAAVVAVGAAGIFAVGNLTGSVDGGAESPDELGLALMTAIENEDVLGMMDVLVPGERDVFRDPAIDLIDELTRLEILSPEADLARILGLDVDLSNETVSVEMTNVPDIANLDMSAEAVVSIDGADVPIGALITDNLPDDMLTEMRGTRVTQTESFDVTMTAVAHDGRWYLSLFHTIAEAARAEFDPSTQIPAEGIGADGGDTPEAAVNGLFDAVEALDLTGLMRRLNPGEAAALQRYAPLFVEEAQSLVNEAPLTWEITTREFRVVGDGETRTVLIDALAIDGVVDGMPFTVSFADGCIVAEADGERFEQCDRGEPAVDLDEILGEAPAARELIDTMTEAFADMEEIGLELRRFDGQWYVSPVTTVTEAVLAVLRALDRSEIDAIVDQAPAAFEEFGESIFEGLNALPGSIGGANGEEIDVLFDDDLFDDDLSDDDLFDDDAEFDDDLDPLDEAWSECYSVSDVAEATACFDSVSAAGGPDASLMPLALRFPECGYAVSWEPGFYQLPDAEFIAAAEAARPCFLDLVEQGTLEEWELPSEIIDLECFEGRNWYQVFDDPEYDERYFECVGAE